MSTFMANLTKLVKEWYLEFALWCYKNKFMNKKAEINKMYIPTDHEHCANTISHAIMILPSIFISETLLSKAIFQYKHTR